MLHSHSILISREFERLKSEANALYKAANYRGACDVYSDALTRFDEVTDDISRQQKATLFSNRAAALLMLNSYDKAIQDCKQSLLLQQNPKVRDGTFVIDGRSF